MLEKGGYYKQLGYDCLHVTPLIDGEKEVPCCYAYVWSEIIEREGMENASLEELIAFLKEQDEDVIYHNEEEVYIEGFGGYYFDEGDNLCYD